MFICFVDRCLSFCPYYFGHCVVCPSLIYGFGLPLWYFQALLHKVVNVSTNIECRNETKRDLFVWFCFSEVLISIYIQVTAFFIQDGNNAFSIIYLESISTNGY